MKFVNACVVVLISFFLFECGGPTRNINVSKAFIDNLVKIKVGDLNYSISVPKGYKLEETRGGDFSVYHFTKMDTTLDFEINGGLYFGNHPSRFPAGMGCTEMKINSVILNQNASWIKFQCANEISVQTIVGSESDEMWNHEIHAFAAGKNDEEVQMVLYVFSTLEVNK